MKVQFSSEKRLAPDVEEGVKLPYAPGKRAASKAGWYIILAIVCSPLVYFIYQIFTSSVFVTEPGYVTLIKREINSTVSGRVLAVEVKVGDEVRAGQVIARLEDRNLDAQSKRVAAEMRAFERVPVSGPSETERALATQRLELSEDELVFFEDRYESIATLFDRGAATRAELNNAHAAVRRAQVALTEVKANLAAMDRTPVAETNSTAYARLKAQADELEDRHRQLIQIAPTAGRVLDIFAEPSEMMTPGTEIILVGEAGGPFITAYIDPKYSKYAQLGQRAKVKLPSGQNVGGKIVELPEVTQRLPAEFVGPLGLRRMKVLARLELDQPLAPGDSVDGLPVLIRFPFKL